MFRVYYDLGCCEGWYYEDFEELNEAINFADKQQEANIVKYTNIVPISYNVKIIW